ncbi:C2H2 zinc finger protein [Klebsormidium nitens]|uniref:C2H2 zinc finger protein n=1 Tax=Klebsormidium nitens TaxID=105231 RepID=A0A1Y1HVL4_KLENI|nr:C2H2 zinc finger protein [Klebsormidium nitens]|eukprot:GAQ82203.1 C2H2 zinc finger protein [Klebsormidium nitens]
MFDVFRPAASGHPAAAVAPSYLAAVRPESETACCGPSTSGASKQCELCPKAARVFCDADSAYLCSACDVRVHTANFLVSRHVRTLLCIDCQGETTWRACGGRPGKEHHRCKACEETARRLKADEDQCVPSGGVDASWLTLGPILSHPLPSRGAVAEDRASGRWGRDTVREEQAAISPSGSSAVSGLSEEREATVTPSSVLIEVPRGERKRAREEGDDGPVAASHKHQKVDHAHRPQVAALPPRPQRSAPLRPNTEPAMTNAAIVERLERTLARWYVSLNLNSPETIPLSMHIFRKVLQSLQPNLLAAEAMRVTLAGCLWLATKVDTAQVKVPKASEVAVAAGVQASRLSAVELQLLTLLDWRLLDGWVGSGEVLDS